MTNDDPCAFNYPTWALAAILCLSSCTFGDPTPAPKSKVHDLINPTDYCVRFEWGSPPGDGFAPDSSDASAYDESGRLRMKGNFERGLREGVWHYYSESGGVLCKEVWASGLLLSTTGGAIVMDYSGFGPSGGFERVSIAAGGSTYRVLLVFNPDRVGGGGGDGVYKRIDEEVLRTCWRTQLERGAKVAIGEANLEFASALNIAVGRRAIANVVIESVVGDASPSK